MESIKRNLKSEYFFLRLLTFIRYFGDCFYYGFFMLFLKSRGLDESAIGMVSAITPIITLAMNPFWNYLSKDANKNRKIMMLISAIEGIFIILFTQVTMFEFICLMTGLVAVVGSPFYTLHDGFSETYAATYHKNYTNIRYWGTFGYIVASLVAALILKLNGNNYDTLLYIAGFTFILVSFMWFLIKPIDLTLTKHGEEVKRNYKGVLTNKTFWLYATCFFLIFTVSNALDAYTGLYFTEFVKVSDSSWSIIFSGILITEFVVMVIVSKFKDQFSPNIALVVAGLSYFLRSLVFALGLPVYIVIPAAFLRGISYGLLLPSQVMCIKKICGIENVTTALFIIAIGVSIIMPIANILYGQLITHLGYQALFMIVAGICLVGNIINLIYQFTHKFNYSLPINQ